MPRPFVTLFLSSSGAELAVRDRSSWVSSAKLPGAAGDTRVAWLASLGPIGPLLAAAVNDADVLGQRVRVVYESPSQQVDLVGGSEDRASDPEAIEAKVRESAGEEADEYVWSSLRVTAKGLSKLELVVSDHEAVVEGIREMVVESGLIPESIVPAGAISLMRAVHSVSNCQGVTAAAVLGDSSSFLVCAEDGQISFSRRLSLNLLGMAGTLVSASETVGLGAGGDVADQARDALFAIGLNRDAPPPTADSKISVRDVVASLLPSVQRLQVELRQSMRFGVTEAQRSSLTFELRGHGACVPGLAAAIEQSLEAPVKVETTTDKPQSPSVNAAQAFDDHETLHQLGLVAPSEVELRRERHAKKLLLAGGVAAALVLGLRVMSAADRADDFEAQLQAAEADGVAAQSIEAAAEAISIRAGRASAFRAAIETHAPGTPSVAAILTHISLSAPEGVVIRSFDVRKARSEFIGTISGELAAPSETMDSVLGAFTNALESSEVLSQVQLRNVSQAGEHAVRFDIGFIAARGPSSLGFRPLTMEDSP